MTAFPRMYRRHVNRKYPDEEKISSFRLDPDQPTKVPVLLQRRGDVGNWNQISGDSYKKPCPQEVTGHVGKNYPPALLDFLWLLLYAHLSPECNTAIRKLLSGKADLKKVSSTSE